MKKEKVAEVVALLQLLLVPRLNYRGILKNIPSRLGFFHGALTTLSRGRTSDSFALFFLLFWFLVDGRLSLLWRGITSVLKIYDSRRC